MNLDVIRTVATYTIALVIIVGGGTLLVIPTQLDSASLLPFLTGAIGTVLGYVFGERVASAATSAQPTITTSSGPPASVTVKPGSEDKG